MKGDRETRLQEPVQPNRVWAHMKGNNGRQGETRGEKGRQSRRNPSNQPGLRRRVWSRYEGRQGEAKGDKGRKRAGTRPMEFCLKHRVRSRYDGETKGDKAAGTVHPKPA